MKDSIVIEPKSKASSCVIWLHGLGADGNDFVDVIPQLRLPDDHRVRFIFPHAPVQPVTINMGMSMRAWYDIKSIDDSKRDIDRNGIEKSICRIEKIIKMQIDDGIDSENIILIGFSQGGAVAALTTLCSNYKFAGAALLSTYLPDWDYFTAKVRQVNNNTRFLVAHGINDAVVPFAAGQLLNKTLVDEGYNVSWHQYLMEHSVCLPEIQDIAQFIKKCITTNAV